MAFSFDSYTGDGATTEYSITFNYLTETVVVSSVPKGIEVHLDGIKQTSGYTVNTSTHKVNFTSPPASAVQISILRSTPRAKADRLVDFSDGTIITEAQLDTVSLQLLYIAQEAFEQTSSSQTTAGSGAPTYLPYNEQSGDWDAIYAASTQTIRNLKEPTADDAAANKLYVDNVAEWGISGVPQQWTFSGTGSTDIFTLTGGPNIEEEMLVVSIDGALQIPNTDFSVIQGSTDSTLDFDTAPALNTVINVQNFGKMRFLDNINIEDGAIDTIKLDQTVGTEAVTTATMRDDAVTVAKIADGTIDFARMNASTFTTSTGDTTPRFISIPVSGTGLSLGTLSTASISDFNTNVNAKRLSDFQPPIADISMGNKKITTLEDPSSAQHAATKNYVDDQILTIASSGMDRLGVYNLSTKSASFEINNWYHTDYSDYEFHCVGFTQDDDTTDAMIVMQFADSSGTYQINEHDVDWYARVAHMQTGGYPDDHVLGSSTGYNRMGIAVPYHKDSTTYLHRHSFKLWLPGNNTSNAYNKEIISEGYGYCTNETGNGIGGFDLYAHYRIANYFVASSGVVTKIRFKATDSTRDTSFSAQIVAGARVLVYGRKHN
jgi:hypothetical protein